MRLTKGMYGHEFKPESKLFGISCGQMRSGPHYAHNAGWYNSLGEKLGWGDLSFSDIQRISEELEGGELFVVLPESASFWNFVTRPGMIGALCETKPDINAPGIDYVADKANYVIAKGKIYSVSPHKAIGTVFTWGPVEIEVIHREGVKALMEKSEG